MTGAVVEFDIRSAALSRLFASAPSVAYFWTRRALFGVLLDHRLQWLRTKGAKLRGGERGVKVRRVGDNATDADLQDRDVAYNVHGPERVAYGARDSLALLGAEVFTGSEALGALESGAQITARGRMLAIPVRQRQPSMGEWIRTRNPSIRYVRSKRDPEVVLVYERLFKRRRGRPREDESAFPLQQRRRGKLQYVLRRQVNLDPVLRFYSTWDGQSAGRAERMASLVDRIVKDLEAGALAKDAQRAASAS